MTKEVKVVGEKPIAIVPVDVAAFPAELRRVVVKVEKEGEPTRVAVAVPVTTTPSLVEVKVFRSVVVCAV